MRVKPKRDTKKVAMSLAVLLFAGLVINAGWATPLEKPGELKTLWYEQFYFVSQYDKPSVKIIRAATDYESLLKTHDKLPAAETIDFNKNAVVAVYATLPDACYFLAFEQKSNSLKVTMRADPDAMCVYVLSNVAAIELVPVKAYEELKVELVKDNS